ncbi:MAG: hypothetical protein A2Z21_04820 [Candidatus Fraserbacteria bacterium RBG_16_55_9]|uniref:Amino acid permease n=1 Tax=Fraserbacteria sp. (strain RBG_16_55_9) TaxID=1817864 RepID=A0A1F5UYD9_FRAXR|nr:MAG: hypothetical protein A2Z21_04820 [Candidatus Fraserbacteria bacterium RBG_16_55_9]
MWRILKRIFIGDPLPTRRGQQERLALLLALGVLASDALSSVAYGPEQILTVLSQAGDAALALILSIAVSIAGLIWLVVISYRQLLLAYPQGGGSYSVAKENLGTFWGLLAGAALLVDYVLTVAVSLSAGMAAVASAWPELHVSRTELTLFILLFMALINLRGVRESGWTFGLPTYVFVGSVFLALGMGFWRFLSGAPLPAPGPPLEEIHALNWFLILKAFSSGATTLTGIEAISNGVGIFRSPEDKNARKTLLYLGLLLTVMLLGVAYLTQHLGLTPTPQETLLSQLARWATGGGIVYYVLQLSTFLVLFLAANTSFSGFPRLASIIARDGFLPRQLRNVGDRLVYSNGIVALALLAGVLIYVFEAETDRLIPLYAIGVFTAFTLSQGGMAAHVLRTQGSRGRFAATIATVGAVITGLVAVIFAVTKFIEGAWIILLVIPLVLWFFYAVRAHYVAVSRQLLPTQVSLKLRPVLAVVPVNAIHRGILGAIEYARSISSEVHIIHVEIDPEETVRLRAAWPSWSGGLRLQVLPSPYRSFLETFNEYLNSLQESNPEAVLTVVIPEFIPARPWQQLMHNQSALLLKLHLYGREGVVVVNVPYHLKE